MSSTNGTTPLLVGGIPIVWLVVLSCVLIVIGVCALTYPLILLNRWRLKEKARADNEEEEEEEEEEDYEPEPKHRRRKSRSGGSIFGKGRASTRGKWVERNDPTSGQPYFEHTGTGEVTWTDPRPMKMRNQKKVANTPMPGNNLVVSTFAPGFPMGGPGGYGAPGGFGGAPRPGMMAGPPMAGPPLAHTGSMGHMPHANSMGHMPHVNSMGQMMPPQMQNMPRPMQSFPQGAPMGGPPMAGPPGAAPPPGMASANSIRRTQAPGAPAPAAPAPAPPAADPKFDKYTRMQKAGLPEGAIRNAMNRDGISDAEQKTFFG